MPFFTKQYHAPGTPPGTFAEIPAVDAAPVTLRLIDYGADEIATKDSVAVSEAVPYLDRDSVTWLHVQGQTTPDMLHEITANFHLHPLAMEDVQNTGQRPKIEPFDDELFVVMNLPSMENNVVTVRQVSLFLGKSFLVSFCPGGPDPFDAVLKRLDEKGTRLRSRGADYLLYTLLDIVIDEGFPVLENFGHQLEEVEEHILSSAGRETLETVHFVKRELILLRRILWPQREVINSLLRDGHTLIQEDTNLYLRDCYDHTIQIMDLVETYRDMTASMLEIYLSSISNRMNEVMRVLTVIATLFIPPTFIASLYGMNFDRDSKWYMPELGWPFGYLAVVAIMVAAAIGMLIFFRRRNWF
jgi:magnesium transporter